MQAVDPSHTEIALSQKLANLLKSAGDTLRIEILRALAQDSFGVLELSHIFDVKQNSMSHHLKVLATAALVDTRREGNSIFYRRSTPHHSANGSGDGLDHTRAMLFESIDLTVLPMEVINRIREVHAQRSLTSTQFFSEHGNRLKDKQDLIAAFDVYGIQVAHFIGHTHLSKREKILEIGPGEGELLPKLAEIFPHVYALDNSPVMLEAARTYCEAQSRVNVKFILGDTSWCQQKIRYFDCVVVNMVLHHTPSPQQIFADISIALNNTGVLIVCELCNHDQDWTRQACGDLWLGFEPKDLTHWAEAAELTEGESSYFALRNGFQIQIREFIKKNA